MASIKFLIDMEANSAKLVSEAQKANQAIKGVNDSLTAIKWDAIANLATKAISTIREAFETLEQATVKLQIEQTFYALANAAGMSGKSLVESMKSASQGTVSEMDIMKDAILGLKSHLDPEMFTKLTDAAIEFSAVTGLTVTESLHTMFTVIQTGRMRQLAGMEENVRVITTQLNIYAVALGKNNAEQLTAQQRAIGLYEILQQLAVGYKAANVQLSEQFLAVQKAKASWENFCDFLYKVALAAVVSVQAGFWNLVAIVKYTGAAILNVLATVAEGFSHVPGLGFLKDVVTAAKVDILLLLAEADEAKKKGEDLNKTWLNLRKPPTDIPGRGKPLPIQPGMAQSGMGVAQSQLQEERKVYEERMAILNKYAEQEKTITERNLSELDVQRAQHLVGEEAYLNQKADIEQQGTIKLQENLQNQIATTQESYDEMISDLKATTTKTVDERTKLLKQVLGLEAEKQKKLEDLQTKGLALEEKLQKESDQRKIGQAQHYYKTLTEALDAYYSLEKQKLEGESRIAQARASAGEIRPEQASMIEYQNNLKMIDLDIKHIEDLGKEKTTEEEVVKLSNQMVDLLQKRNQLEKEAAITLKSETAPAYQGLGAGFQKYVTEQGTMYTQLRNMTNSLAKGMEGAFSNFFVSIFDKTKSWKEKMQGLFQGLANSFIKALSDMAAKALVTNLFGGSGGFGSILWSLGLKGASPLSVSGGAAGIGGGGVMEAAGGSELALIAQGGILPGGFTPIKAFAGGGITNRPTLGLIGEKGPEAVIPLDKMKQGGDTYITNTYIQATDVDSFRRLYGPTIEGINYNSKRFNKVSQR